MVCLLPFSPGPVKNHLRNTPFIISKTRQPNVSRKMLVLFSGEGEYVAFLCSLPNINQEKVEAATGGSCSHSLAHPADLNQPSVTITSLIRSQVVNRNVINVGNKQETYLCAVLPPNGVTVDVSPTWFTISPGESQHLELKLNVSQSQKEFSFGEIVLTGSLDHIVRVPLSVLAVTNP